MDAPIYPPATAYIQPAFPEATLQVENWSIAELRAAPAAWAIVMRHAPLIEGMVSDPGAQATLNNSWLEGFLVFPNVVTPSTLQAINADLRRLPRSQGPKV